MSRPSGQSPSADSSAARAAVPAVDLARNRHDLRTSLNPILACGKMLQEGAGADGHTFIVPDLKRIANAARDRKCGCNYFDTKTVASPRLLEKIEQVFPSSQAKG